MRKSMKKTGKRITRRGSPKNETTKNDRKLFREISVWFARFDVHQKTQLFFRNLSHNH